MMPPEDFELPVDAEIERDEPADESAEIPDGPVNEESIDSGPDEDDLEEGNP